MVFPLASMQWWLGVLTAALFLLPAGFLYGAFIAPAPVSFGLMGTTLLLLIVYASVWLVWRPLRFEVGATTLRIVWPVRSRTIARADIESASILSAEEFRREYGYGMRVGAGGLWGGFGLLKTGRETFSMWISRTDAFVLVRLRGARTLLITPEDPERFVATLIRLGTQSGGMSVAELHSGGSRHMLSRFGSWVGYHGYADMVAAALGAGIDNASCPGETTSHFLSVTG